MRVLDLTGERPWGLLRPGGVPFRLNRYTVSGVRQERNRFDSQGKLVYNRIETNR